MAQGDDEPDEGLSLCNKAALERESALGLSRGQSRAEFSGFPTLLILRIGSIFGASQ